MNNIRPSIKETIIPTLCHGCGPYKTHCGVLCHITNGKFVRVEGNPQAYNNWGKGCTSLCAKGYTGPQYVYTSDRLKYPLKRIGQKGEGKFQRITWDEALDTIANQLKEYKVRYGPEVYGLLSPEFSPVVNTLGRRFLNIYGSPNYMHSAICATPRMAAAKTTIGFYSMAPDDWQRTKLIVNWGANLENSSINNGHLIGVINAVRNGAKLIDIRPMLDPLGTKADIWLPIRPGTDCALALAFLNVIIIEQLYDTDFVSNWCYGFDKLAEYVKPFTPEWAATKTGLPAERIIQVSRLIGTIKPAFIKTGNGIGDQTNDGSATTAAISLIAAITGNIDVPGGHVFNPAPMVPTVKAGNLEEMTPPDMVDKLVAPESPGWYQTKDNWESGPTSAYYKGLMSILTGKPYPLRILNSSNTNPLSATRNPKKVAEALNKVEFMFAADSFWGPHLNYADIILPACTVYEQSDYYGVKQTGDGTWISIFNRVIEPLGESHSDWQIYLDLAMKMGFGEYFWNGKVDTLLNERLAFFGVTAEQLRQNPYGILIKGQQTTAPAYRKYSLIFKNLPHGKVQCYNEFLGGKENNDGTGKLPYFPVYKGPPEGIAETPELVKEYPLIISDVHAHRLSQHSFMHNIPYLRELQPYPWIKINPATAKKYGIADGDWVKVESLYGWCKFKAEYFEGISPEVLMTKRGWSQPCGELNLTGYSSNDGGSEVNNLYNSDEKLFDKFFSQMSKQTLVRICKLENE